MDHFGEEGGPNVICLPPSNSQYNSADGKIAGWGYTDEESNVRFISLKGWNEF